MSIANVTKGIAMAAGLGLGVAAVAKATNWAWLPDADHDRPIVKPALAAVGSLAAGMGLFALAASGKSTHAAVEAAAVGAATLGFTMAVGGTTLNGIGALTNVARTAFDA